MNAFTTRISSRIASMLVGMLIALTTLPATADDTELFIGTSNPLLTGVQPNILFIYDNSGSMDSEVLTQEPWNPNTDFEGCYNTSRLYFSTNSTPPGCNSQNYIDASVNYCQASVGLLNNVGTYTDEMQAWRAGNTKRWVDLSTTHDRPMECQNDAGTHGQTSGTYYAVNGNNGPWSSNANNQIAWNRTYTIWSGNWMNWYNSGGTVSKTRIQVVREVTDNLLQDLNGVNVGLMHFNTDQGGTVAHAMENIATSRASMQTAVNALTAETYTPLSETLYEATNYYMGRDVDYGNVGPVKSVAASRTSNTINGTTYKKPATYACQKNYIVLLTDGLPTQDLGATAKIKALPDWAANVTDATCTGASGSDGECMSDLAEYLNRHDLDANLAGLQNVTTYTIGFGVDLAVGDTTFLEATATKGGGTYFPATDTATLATALTAIVTEILDDATTFSAPTAPVNAFNRTQNLNDVFVSVFAPAVNEHWPGNLKKYRLQGGELVGADGATAVDPGTGFFSDTSRSYWSDSVDGNTVTLGGGANELPVDTARNLYTNISGNDLNATGNAVAVTNAGITAALIGAPDDPTRDRVINWARGLDLNDENDNGITTDVRHVMGDPLHVRPVMVIYGGSASTPDATVFVSTNDGYLHAIDPDDGSELWAFIPQDLLGRLNDLYLDDAAPTRSYGLDGEITVSIENNDNVPGISSGAGERVLLFFGMRRGGNAVFALDVTNRADPQFLWKISSDTTGFEALGQTWSTPTIASVDIDGTVHRVAIFGGGYDDGQDAVGYRTDTHGNAIYMVDALTGQLLWKAGNGTGFNLNLGEMTHSIPAAVRVLDMDQDHLADRMYVGDMGGRVWRFDIINGEPVADLVQGGVFASLGAADLASPTNPDVRRFYATPDVAQIVTEHGAYLSVSLGSGHREHPLDTGTDDEFYSLRDFNVSTVLPNDDDSYQNPIVRSDLTDITDDVSPTLDFGSPGWRLRLDLSAGEKVVSESRTFANQVFFTSFTPGGNGDACVAAGGLNRLYVVSVADGSPVTNLDGSQDADELTAEDRVRTLNQGGIAPDPAFFFPGPETDGEVAGIDVVTCIGVECFPPGFGNPPVRTLWNQDGTE